MADINRVVLVGRLVRDAELKFTNASAPVARFSLAVKRNRKNGDQWEEEVSYIDIVLWGRSAEAVSKYLTKGKQIAVEGELRQDRWEQDGQQRSKLMVVANNVQLLSGGVPSQSQSQGQSQMAAFSRRPSGAAGSQMSAPEPEHFVDDGIPF